MRRILGIDPDTTATGWALLTVSADAGPRGFSFEVGVVRAKGRLAVDRAPAMAAGLREQLATVGPLDVVAIEWQHARPGDPRPDNIVAVGAAAGMALAAAVQNGARYLLPIPSDWKGTIDKAVHQWKILRAIGAPVQPMAVTVNLELPAEVRRILDLVPEFQGILTSQRTHALDALGLALWASKQP